MRDLRDEQVRQLAREAKVRCRELKGNQFLDAASLRRIRNERFVKMVRHAYANVPMYRKKYDDAGVDIDGIRTTSDAEKLPIIEKSDLIENFPNNAIAPAYELSELTTAITGGSSGKT